MISDRERNTERDANIKQKKGVFSIGLVFSILFTFLITLCYIWIYFDGIVFPTVGWIGLSILWFILLFEMILISIIRSSIFIHKSYSATRIFIIFNWICIGLIFSCFVFNIVYHWPLSPAYHLGYAVYIALYPIILTTPIHISLFLNKETFLTWSGFSKKNLDFLDPKKQRIKRINFIIFSITYLGVAPTIFLSFPYFFFPSIAFISLYYCWFFFFELLWKRLALKRLKKQSNLKGEV